MTTATNPATDAGKKDFTNPQSKAKGVTPGSILENNEPKGIPMRDMWSYQKDHMELVSPLNRRKFTVLVVGTGLSGGAAAAARQGHREGRRLPLPRVRLLAPCC